ncbi:helix-turn-helix domain-containing protein [Paraburkholderia pallida]|uniref:Helix-turn-helix domain-containing protein n=1 Tax=Paraburkholderia pallida TaxID=2547399 RepID=A0A4P7D461_9BURK|nr:helix-turn-helix domain-containing protein [Paraburkholderia pallida]
MRPPISPSFPQSGHVRQKTRLSGFDPHTLREALQEGVLEHVQLEVGQFRGTIAHSASRELQVDWGNYSLSVMARGALNRNRVTLGMLLSGKGDWRLFGTPVENGLLVVAPEGSELVLCLPTQPQWVSIQVERERLDAIGVDLGLASRSGGSRLTGYSDAMMRTLQHWSSVLLANGAGTDEANAELALAHEDILSVLLGELNGRQAGRGAFLDAGERWRIVRRAQDFLDAQRGPLVRIDDLCQAAHTSLSTLERAFQEAFGCSPRRFLILRRMSAVRQELLRGELTTSVTEVATRWGFFHLGRFAVEYAKLFHERPSDTLRQPIHGAGHTWDFP